MQNLSQEEQDVLLEALPIVTVLVASADGKIDESETAWAEKLTHIRSYANETDLNDFYQKVETNFMEKVNWYISQLPESTEAGVQLMSDKLAALNDILPKLPQDIAAKFYLSLKSFARHIARADGGLFKIWSISKEEAALIELPMIQPIEMPVEEEGGEDNAS